MFDILSPLNKPILIVCCLVFVWTAETIVPMVVGRKDRVGHNARNLLLAGFNALVGFVLVGFLLMKLLDWVAANDFGVLNWLNLEGVWAWVVAILLFDCWQYTWHMINHKVPLFWRFHAVHHTDTEMDASTGVRFHFVEIGYSFFARLLIIPLIGMKLEHMMVYELLSLPVILFHHGNLWLPGWADRVLRVVIVTPWMHWVHHSDYQPETDSNYSSFLSVWDRLFGTFRLREDPRTIDLGLKNTPYHDHHDLGGMLGMPFRKKVGGDEGADEVGGEGLDDGEGA